MFTWPFASLIMTPIRYHIALWKVFHMWTHVVLTLAACGLVLRDLRRPMTFAEDRRNLQLSAPWLIGNTLFTLCVGHIWGFYQFHRFILVALPPMLWAFRKYFPDRRAAWIAIAVASAALGLVGILRSDATMLG